MKDSEFLITISELLVGLLIIATIVGNVGSLVTNMNLDQMIFTNHLDCVKRWIHIIEIKFHNYLQRCKFEAIQISFACSLLNSFRFSAFISCWYGLPVDRYMKLHRVTDQVNHRIIRWFGYIWEEGLWLDEEQFLHTLPANLRSAQRVYVWVNLGWNDDWMVHWGWISAWNLEKAGWSAFQHYTIFSTSFQFPIYMSP